MSGPLEGIRVVDACRASPGRQATGLLADYGADVISVLEPRSNERNFAGVRDETARVRLNPRNRRSLFLNLKAEGAREVFYKLAKSADAFLESYRPGVTQRLGIDYDSLRKVNPGIVYCSLSGYGQEGPYRDLAGHDLNYQAVGGLLPQDEKGRPVMPVYNDADRNATWNGTIAILMGLLHRARTGRGQFIDVTFVDSAIQLPPGIFELRDLRGVYPGYNTYECQDGEYITLGVLEPRFWERLCRTLGREDLLSYQRPEGPRQKEVLETFRQIFKSKPRDEWFRILREHDVPVAPVHLSTEEVVNDPHHRARGSILELEEPSTGKKKYEPGFAMRFAETKATLRWGPTPEGGHTREILRELGYSEAEMTKLAEKGVTRPDV